MASETITVQHNGLTFEIQSMVGMTTGQMYNLIDTGWNTIGKAEWRDEEYGTYEKEAALKAGIKANEPFAVRFSK